MDLKNRIDKTMMHRKSEGGSLYSYSVEDVVKTVLEWHREQLSYKRNFRKYLCKPLSILVDNDGPLTSEEIAKKMDNKFYAKKQVEHFAELRFWKLIKRVGVTDKGHPMYEYTICAYKFLQGELAIPSHVYTYKDGNELKTWFPEEGDQPVMKYIHEITNEDFSDKERHLEESVQSPMI